MFDTQILLPCFSGPGSDSTGSMSGAESFDNYSFSSVTSVQTADAANVSTSRGISCVGCVWFGGYSWPAAELERVEL